VDVTVDDFYNAVLMRSHERPVVVDFWADWCAPCRALEPVLEREASARGGAVELVRVNVDASPELASEYEVRGIPAVKAFRNGRVVDEFVGVQSPASVAEFFERLTGPSGVERLVTELRESGAEPRVLAALEASDYEQALALLLEEAQDAEPERREEIRRLMVTLFQELGQDHPAATKYRRRLATILY
jgi:putative thioredoxin